MSGISKTFRVVQRGQGLRGAAGALFHREYREIRALRNVSFDVPDGALVGMIGPNGAGKSTCVKVMAGILVPSSGTCEIMGYVPWRDRARYVGHLGVVFGQRTQLWWDVPVRDSFELLRDIYRVPEDRHRRTRERYTDLLDLGDLLDRPLRQLSLGQRMRCELAASLLHEPKILFLDEPTIGLDAVSKQAVRTFIREINRDDGVTVILITHDTADLEALADRILLLGHGQLLYDGTLEGLRARYDTDRTLTVRFTGNAGDVTPPGCTLISSGEGMLVYRIASDTVPSAIAQLAGALSLTDVRVEEKPVDEVIATLYRDLRIQ